MLPKSLINIFKRELCNRPLTKKRDKNYNKNNNIPDIE